MGLQVNNDLKPLFFHKIYFCEYGSPKGEKLCLQIERKLSFVPEKAAMVTYLSEENCLFRMEVRMAVTAVVAAMSSLLWTKA
jgi:hypothetical protein